ncbi:hypothetical protein SAMN06297280_3440 [Arsukibacterium tuosuense]|uniref:Uncharacterized protein n=1 Tax=Arsukibacterium tuosuense TaxID=1323745 RepID=A0A285JHH6_9GAMM|nr:hypothetical protein SAMN06297280_3440 [Arsukibacterium tuosuense]
MSFDISTRSLNNENIDALTINTAHSIYSVRFPVVTAEKKQGNKIASQT